MGQQCCSSSPPPSSSRSSLLLSEWTRLPAVHGAFIWKNLTTNQQIQQYSIINPSKQSFSQELAIIHLRLNNPHLVSSKAFINDTTGDLCGCSTNYHGRIFLEKILYRLSNLNEIPFPDVLHVYSQAFKGYQELVGVTGWFIVEEEMIGINEGDVVKVWVNGNFARSFGDGMRLKTEGEMVMTVVQAIQRNTQESVLAGSLKEYFKQGNPQTFSQALEMLEEWAKVNQMVIPERLECLREMRLRRQRVVVEQNTSQVVVNRQQHPSKIVATHHLVQQPPIPTLSSVKSTGALIQRSRVLVNPPAIANKSSLISQKSVQNLIVQKPGPTTSQIHLSQLRSVSPFQKTPVNVPVSVSPIKSQTKSMINYQIKAPVAVPTSTRMSTVKPPTIPTTHQSNIPKPPSNVLNQSKLHKTQEISSNNKILQTIKNSQQQTKKLIDHNLLLPRTSSTKQLASSRYLEQINSPITPAKAVKMQKIEILTSNKPQITITQVVSTHKEQIQDTYKTPFHLNKYEQKVGEVTTDYKSLQRQQTEKQQIISRIVEQSREEHQRHEQQQTLKNIKSSAELNKKNNMSPGSTSFQFFGFVNVNNPTEKTNNTHHIETTNQQTITHQHTHHHHHRQQTKVSDYFTSSATNNNIESRLQLPSIPSQSHLAFKQLSEIKQSTINPYQSVTYAQQKYSRVVETPLKPIQPTYPTYDFHHTSNYESRDYKNLAPITNSYGPSYGGKDYMDIYNVTSSYSSYVPIPESGSSRYLEGNDKAGGDYLNYNTNYNNNNYSSYGDLSRYNVGGNYKELDPYASNLVDKYTKNIDNFNPNTYNPPSSSSVYNYNYSSSYNSSSPLGLQNYNTSSSPSYPKLDTYIVPTYDTYSIPKYQDIDSSPIHTPSRYNLKQTQLTADSRLYNTHQSNLNSSNHFQTQQHHEAKAANYNHISTEGYNLEYLASIYIPIQGYKVTIDNEVLADLQKLRARGLMEEAIGKEMERKRAGAL